MASVRVILTEDIEHLGAPGDIVNVAPGYARNYLLPKQVALEATVGNMRMLENKLKVWKDAEARRVGNAEALRARIAALDARFERLAGDRGVLFGSVTNQDIAEFLVSKGLEIERKHIKLKAPIKTTGSHEAAIKLHRKVTVILPIEVIAEGKPEQPAEPESAKETEPGEDATTEPADA